MRVCFLIFHIGELGGTERATTAVLNGLAASGGYEALHLLEVVPCGPPVFPLDPAIQRAHLFDRHVSLLGAWPRLAALTRRYVLEHRIDVLVVVESTHALYAVPALMGTGTRRIVWEHFNFLATNGKRKRAWGRRIAARFAEDVVTLTERDIALWRDHARPHATMTCIPNIAPPVREGVYPRESRVVLAAGRLSAQKGFDLLLRAWALVEGDARGAGWRLLIAGDGEEREALEHQASGMRVEIVAARAGIEALFSEAGMYVCSSRFEGLPMVLLEAASFGVPVVAFDCETGPGEIVAEGRSGVLVPPGDVAGFAEGMLGLMADAEGRARLSRGARVRAGAFQRDAIVARWRALLDA